MLPFHYLANTTVKDGEREDRVVINDDAFPGELEGYQAARQLQVVL